MKFAGWILLIFWFFASNLWATDTPVLLQTNPAPHLIEPDRDLVETTITMPPNTEYEIIINTPFHGWISTDFPIVENTQLYQFKGFTQNGEVRFETIYPIRGEYAIEVTANGKTTSLALTVNESSMEIMSMVAFLGILFLIGLVGGQIFLRTSSAKMALALFAIVGAMPFLMQTPAYGHGEKSENQLGIAQWSQHQGNYSLVVQFDGSQAVVGKNVAFAIEVQKDGQVLQEPVAVEIETFHMEDEATMFKGAFTSQTGTMQQTLQFFDGAETKITFAVNSIPNVELLIEEVIAVEGIAPPTEVKVKTMALLTLVVLGGMAVGFFLIPIRKITSEEV